MIEFLKSTNSYKDYPESYKEIVFLGKSNVGKSSLINALYNQKLAYVGKTPGKTKLLNFFNVDNKYTFVDVPGYGYAKRSNKEILDFGNMMEEYFAKRQELKLAILIIDVRSGPSADDLDMIEFLEFKRIPYVIVANKIDKLSNNELFKSKKKILEKIDIEEDNIIYLSSKTKKNISALNELINDYIL